MSPPRADRPRADAALPPGPAAAPARGSAPPRAPISRRRIFIAVRLAPELQKAIADVPVRLGSASRRLRWVPPENLHLTLRFLGEITERQVERVTEAMREVAQKTAPFTITLAGLGAFPSARRPRVVWVGVTEGSDRLVTVAEALAAEIVRQKFPREARPFQPHLTIARVRTNAPPPDIAEDLARAGTPVIGSQDVTALAVMESRLRTSGAEYEEVAQERLGGSG